MKNWWWILLLIAGVAGAAMILQKTRIIVDGDPFVGCKPTPEIIMDFGEVQVGTTATETAEVFNTGDRACLLNAIPLITPADGTVTVDCPSSIPIGGSIVCTIEWTPLETTVPPDGGYVIEAYWDNLVPVG